MTNILFYICPIIKASGGCCCFKLYFDIFKRLGYNVFFCPLLKNIKSLNFNTHFHNRTIDSIKQFELDDYYKECTDINIFDIVSVAILKNRNNVVIYTEDVIGNPAEQEYVVRLLLFFPIPAAVISYNFEKDLIVFFSDYVYNFYKYACASCKVLDLLTNKIKNPTICRVFIFDQTQYDKSKTQKRIKYKSDYPYKSAFTMRKFFPPANFVYRPLITEGIAESLLNDRQIAHKKNQRLWEAANNSVIENYTTRGFTNVTTRETPLDFIRFFNEQELFISFDPFTFMIIISSLCGNISIVNKIPGLVFNDWIKGDPMVRYGVAYGYEGIEYALKTRHLLFDHISNLYSQNTNNVINLANKIEEKFNIKLGINPGDFIYVKKNIENVRNVKPTVYNPKQLYRNKSLITHKKLQPFFYSGKLKQHSALPIHVQAVQHLNGGPIIPLLTRDLAIPTIKFI